MISFTRTAGVAAGKTAGAIGFAHEVSAHFKKHYDVDMEVLMPVGGNPSRITWAARYPDMATMEAVRAKSLADRAYMALVAKGTDLFVAGSLRDAIWVTV